MERRWFHNLTPFLAKLKGDKRFLSHFALTLAAQVRFVANPEKNSKNIVRQEKSTRTIEKNCPCAFLIVPATSSKKPYSKVCFAAVSVKIFLTIIFQSEETDSVKKKIDTILGPSDWQSKPPEVKYPTGYLTLAAVAKCACKHARLARCLRE